MGASTKTTWRVIGPETRDAKTNMFIDKLLLESVSKGMAPQTIRFYQFSHPSITTPVDASSFANYIEGVDLAERPTGGKTLFHDPLDLTVSVVGLKTEELNKKPEIYLWFRSMIRDSLKDMGIESAELSFPEKEKESEFCVMDTRLSNGRTPVAPEVTVNGRKISGSTARLTPNAFLVHGSIFYKPDLKFMSGLFGKRKPAIKRSMTWINEYTEIESKGVFSHLFEHFTKDKEIVIEGFNDYEKELIQKELQNVNLQAKVYPDPQASL